MGIVNSRAHFRTRAPLPVVGSGDFEVGCADLMVAAENEEDVGVFARIFYPAEKKAVLRDPAFTTMSNQFWRPRKEYIDGLAKYKNVSPRRLHFMFDVLVGERRIPCEHHRSILLPENVEPNSSSFPVIIYSHGLSSCRLFSTSYCSSLASYGFVVAAVEHRDRSACWTYSLEKAMNDNGICEKPFTLRKLTPLDNEFRVRNQQLHKRVAECVKLLNVLEEINIGKCANTDEKNSGCKVILGEDFDWTQLKGRLDISRTAAVGHSFGGATAISASAFSTEFRAAVVLDGWMLPIEKELYPRAVQPTLFLNADRFQWPENVRSMLRVGDNPTKNPFFTLRGITHYSFTDLPLVVPSFIGRKMGIQGKTDAVRCLEAVVETSVLFLRNSFEGEEFDFSSVKSRYVDFLCEGTILDLTERSTATVP